MSNNGEQHILLIRHNSISYDCYIYWFPLIIRIPKLIATYCSYIDFDFDSIRTIRESDSLIPQKNI